MDPKIIDMGIPMNRTMVDLADKVVMARAQPLREYDQIYMQSSGMITQTILVSDRVAHKHVVFVGDGDGMSMMFGIYGAHDLIVPPSRMTVLDFNKKTLAQIRKFANREGFGDCLETIPYNVFDPPPAALDGVADLFYTNPPYGSKNRGRSGIVFIARGMEMTAASGSGCIVLPYKGDVRWTQHAMQNVQSFLLQHGYVIAEKLPDVHRYHLEDNPTLPSGSMIVDRIEGSDHPFAGQRAPAEYREKFYGDRVTEYPTFIDENGQPEAII